MGKTNFQNLLTVTVRRLTGLAGVSNVSLRANQNPALTGLTSILAIPLVLCGDFFVPDETASRGVKLSAAMDASAKNDRQDLGGDSNQNCSPDAETHSSIGSLIFGGMMGVSYDTSDYYWQLPVEVNYATPFNGDIQSITHFIVTPLSIEEDRDFFGIYIGGAIVDLKPGSLPDRGADGTWMLETGLSYRHYLNSPKTALSPYFACRIGYVLFNWDYRNPIVAGGDTIQSDSVGGIEGSIALGISTWRDSRVSFFSEVAVGGTGFSDTTSQGFENNVFGKFGFFSVVAGLSIKF